MRQQRLENSIGKQSNFTLGGGQGHNGDKVDDLINWANALPDDIESSGNASFYGNMLPSGKKGSPR